jgi:LmbE family N-acetylglucosaminyl deacetylase
VAAHPDDEVLGCGATAARLSRSGHRVTLAILGEGATARAATRRGAGRSGVAVLRRHARLAGKLLGAAAVVTGRLPDNRFDTVPLLDIVKQVEALIARVNPEVVYTHSGGDLNIDHRLTHQAVLTATRPAPGQGVREVYAFEVPSATDWALHRIEPAFRPNVFVDVSGTLAVKIRAMETYATEVRPFPHPRSAQALRATAQRWGSVAGCGAAEAFELMRSLR